MTLAFSSEEVAAKLEQQLPGSVVEKSENTVLVKNEALHEAASFLKDAPGMDFDYLANMTAVDYYDYFEVVYHLVSIQHNHGLVLKTRCYGRDNPTVPSVASLWKSADYQEREAYDLMGIRFDGHPNMKRIVLWEGFEGHPLGKDYL